MKTVIVSNPSNPRAREKLELELEVGIEIEVEVDVILWQLWQLLVQRNELK